MDKRKRKCHISCLEEYVLSRWKSSLWAQCPASAYLAALIRENWSRVNFICGVPCLCVLRNGNTSNCSRLGCGRAVSVTAAHIWVLPKHASCTTRLPLPLQQLPSYLVSNVILTSCSPTAVISWQLTLIWLGTRALHSFPVLRRHSCPVLCQQAHSSSSASWGRV